MYIPLDTKSVYSFLESTIDLESYISRAKVLGYQTIGLMDKENLYGAYHFLKLAKREGMTPLLGLSGQVQVRGEMLELRFLALSTQGYHNLLKISTNLMSGQRALESLLQWLEGVAVIVPYYKGIEELSLPFKFYVGVMPTSPRLSEDHPFIPLWTSNALEETDREILQVLQAVKDNVSLREVSEQFLSRSLKAAEEMTGYYIQTFPDALNNLAELVSGISYELDQKLKLPRFNRERPAVDQLRELTFSGLKNKGLDKTVYIERLEKELSIIHEMGFDDYFLIVWDLLRFGRSRGYYMGMGRGSAAGSLVAYSLDITGIDPVKHHLLFERFLNQERYSMPDIDIDLPDIYRSEFLHYVRDRYGSMHSAQIVTFSTFGAKQAIRDVFKRFGASEFELGQLTKKIGFRDNLKTVYEKQLSFRQLINEKTEYQQAYRIALALEGRPRQTSIHAAGVVMSDDNLTEHIPLKQGEDMMVTQYDADSVESNGLLKMDFLGLRNLTFLQKMAEQLQDETGQVFDINGIDLEDRKTLELFASGKTKGIFQFEQPGAIKLLKRMQPSRFEEVAATTSLNRPGASDYIDNYIARKNGAEAIDLIDPIVAPILEPTYGIMLYQEQVMQISQIFAGFSLGKADLLRRAMSKKNEAEMAMMRTDFMEGAAALGRSQETAEKLFDRMAKFAGYGFNKSHAYAYSALAFQLAYFKAHHPHIFYQVLLNRSSDSYIQDALANDFQLASLSINTIPYYDKIEGNKILLGLKTLKGFSRELAYHIIENRPYSSLENFLELLPEKYQKAEVLEPLIAIGLLDQFEPNRKKLQVNISHLLLFVKELGSLFSDSSYDWIDSEDYSVVERYNLEKEWLGVGLSQHPLRDIEQKNTFPIKLLSQLVDKEIANVLVQIEQVRTIRTKTDGRQMAFLKVTDTRGSIDVTIFPETYHHLSGLLKEGEVFYLNGRAQERDGRLQLILNHLWSASTEKLWLLLKDHSNDQRIASVLKKYPGPHTVILRYQDSQETIQSQRIYVRKDLGMLEELVDYVLKTVFQ